MFRFVSNHPERDKIQGNICNCTVTLEIGVRTFLCAKYNGVKYSFCSILIYMPKDKRIEVYKKFSQISFLGIFMCISKAMFAYASKH
jgi:hypothetical protein